MHPFEFLRLTYYSLRITSYGDAVFANNVYLYSQHRRTVLLTDDNHNYIPVSHRSYKLRHIARSVYSVEVIAFADLFDDAFAVQMQLEFVLR